MHTLLGDLRHAARALRSSPGFTLVAAITLALGIGANTALFSVVYAVLIRPLPYPQAERVLRLERSRDGRAGAVSPPDFEDWRQQSHTVPLMSAINEAALALAGEGEAEQLRAAQVTSDFLRVLQIGPALGRGFSPQNDTVGLSHVAVLSDALWRRRFAADRRVIGHTIRLDGESYEVLGVMPPGFAYPRGTELWVPLAFSLHDLATQRGAVYLEVIGRLAEGVTPDAAAAEMQGIGARLAAAYPSTDEGSTVAIRPLRDALVGDVRSPLLVLLGSVGLVLLIACTNVANLQLARAVGRRREVAVRTALGASRGRIVRALLTEGALLSLIGAVAGVLLAVWGTSMLVDALPHDIAVSGDVTVNAPVLAFALVVSLVSGVLFTLLPALRLTRESDLSEALRAGSRSGTGDRGAHRTNRALVVGETALAVMLLTAAALLIRSFSEMRRTNVGFTADHLLAFDLSLPDVRYRTPESSEALFAQLVERVRALPNVRDVAAGSGLPLSGRRYSISPDALDGRHLSDQEQDALVPQVRVVTRDYFKTLAIPLRRGRAFTDADRAGTPGAVIVNEAAARLIWPGVDALGHSLEIGTGFGLDRGNAGGTVVGVIPDVKDASVRSPSRPTLFFSHEQYPVGYMTLVVRTSSDPLALLNSVRGEVRTLDADLPVYAVHTMDELLREDVSRPHFFAALLGAFAGAALLLAAVGIYGVLAYTVGQRTREIGLRMALGARERDVLRLVAGGGILLALAGVGIGLAASLLVGRLLAGLLYGVRATDLTSLSASAAVLLTVALLASWLPARRASRLDPAIALRND